MIVTSYLFQFTNLPLDCFSFLPAAVNQHFPEATLFLGGTTFQRMAYNAPLRL